MNQDITIRTFRPGDAGYVSYLHMQLYQKEYGFHGIFEYYVMKGLVEFLHDPSGGQLWVVEAEGEIVASIAIVKADDNTAQLRWFLVVDKYRGSGIGKALMKTAIDFCKTCGYGNVFLWTVSALSSARHLYEINGFTLVETVPNTEWASEALLEERWELHL